MAAKKKKKKKKGDKIFNDRPRKMFRHYIGTSEIVFSTVFVGFVLLMGIWFVAQKNNFDPTERDVSYEFLAQDSEVVQDHLWEMPLQFWVEPGSETAAKASGPDIGIYPEITVGDGWRAAKPVVAYNWDNLYEKIDGQETQYKGFGFEAMYYLGIAFSEEDLECSIELYDMGEFQNALGVYAAQRSATSTVEKMGESWVTVTQAGALALYDKYYIKVSGNADSARIREHAVAIVTAFADAAADPAPLPDQYLQMNEDLGVPFKDIAYLKQDVFQYDFATDFWFGKTADGAKTRFYLHKAADDAAAEALFGQLLEENEFEYETVSRDGNNILFNHEFLKTYVTLNQSGPYVFGIEGAASAEEAAELLAKLSGVLSGQ